MSRSQKPKVITKCIANHCAAENERVIEYSFPSLDGNPGGLIIFYVDSKNMPHVHLYRHNLNIDISIGVIKGGQE